VVLIQDLDQLPSVSGIYLVHSQYGEIVYIGQSTNIKNRWKSGHHKLSKIISFYGSDVKITWAEVPPHRLNHAEYIAIKFYNPSLNRKLPSIV
jgi:excinuclease UvrABC nuclease subunit